MLAGLPPPSIPQGWFQLKNNTSVYVTGLPFDTNEKEIAAVFSKCGLIKEGPDLLPRIKLYRCAGLGGGGDFVLQTAVARGRLGCALGHARSRHLLRLLHLLRAQGQGVGRPEG